MIRNFFRISGFYALLLFSKVALAQPTVSLNASQIQLALEKLEVLGSVLYVAAHPDDENTRMLAYLANEKKFRTGYLSITRGDGGQNLIGNEQAELLGLIRTQELLAARSIDGAEQFFTRANDFGYSKGPEETLALWGKEAILADVVFVIRKFRPDVILCRFPTTGEGGHGHHTASAILTLEAFSAAADASRFPEQLQYVSVWQAKRILWNTFRFGGNNTTSEDQFKFDVGIYNPLLGKGYGEIAAESRTMHKSQAFGSLKNRGEQMEYLKTIGGPAPEKELMDGINTTWSRIAGTEKIQSLITQIQNTYSPRQPAQSVKQLISLYAEIEKISDPYWRDYHLNAVKELIAQCSGLWFEAMPSQVIYAPGDSVELRIQAINRSSNAITLQRIRYLPIDTAVNHALSGNQLYTLQRKFVLASTAKISQPYWLQQPHSIGAYKLPGQQWVGYPGNPDKEPMTFTFLIEGKEFTFTRLLQHKYEDPVKGEVYKPMVVAPPVTATFGSDLAVFADKNPKPVKVTVKSFRPNAGGMIRLSAEGWTITPGQHSFRLSKKEEEQTFTFTITPPANIRSTVDTARLSVEMDGLTYRYSLKNIQYDHIPSITLFPPAELQLVSPDLKMNTRRIGYIKGAGDQIPEILQQMGYEVVMLGEEDISAAGLVSLDAIVLGIRAYNTNEWLKFKNEMLFDYVKSGGILVTQYNTSFDLFTEKLGPFPFKISRGRVTEENAPVTFLNPSHPLLNFPNKISSRDFEGWIQERGLYFLNGVDSNYQKILALNDRGENPLDGSLIVARYGKGKYVYTSLSFFRELPSGVPGAFRLFVNLISKNE
jgi:LmbE family N-acetylglucosaminyl deacetylase